MIKIDYIEYITEQALIMIPVLYVIIETIKPISFINKLYLPLISVVISIATVPAVLGGYTADNIVQAVLISGATILIYEAKKNNEKAKEEVNND